jgi:prepilin-type N-terminal cleavage/methylation domain-containing protein
MRPLPGKSRRRNESRNRGAFTLVELLVVVAITLILTTITIVSVNFSISADRVRAGARQIQSLLAGARDRAIYAKDMRGIRLIRDPNDSHVVRSLQYIGAPGKISAGTLTIVTGTDGTIINTTNAPAIYILKNQGLIRVGSRIQIPMTTGRWYTIAGFPGAQQILLSQKYADFYSTAAGTMNVNRVYSGLTYLLELQPQPLPDSTPVQLPKGVVIDLDGSQVPSNWRPSVQAGAYSNQMDILFSAKGLPVGDVVSQGMIHLHIADAGDVVRWNSAQAGVGIDGRNANAYLCTSGLNVPIVPADIPGATGTQVITRDRILVTLSSRTGNVIVAPVNVTNSPTLPTSVFPIDPTRIADDPFFYAETGQVAGK